jgi:hypothetical protein
MKVSNVIAACSYLSCYLLLLYAAPVMGQVQAGSRASIVVDLQFEPDFPGNADVQLFCSFGEPRQRELTVRSGERRDLVVADFKDSGATCQLRVVPVPGYSATYFVGGEAAYKADQNGCQFFQFKDGQLNTCGILLTQDPVRLTVYKKWFGGSGEEEDVQVSLECESGDYSGYRYINEGSPDGWEISQFDPDGVLCNVTETVRDSFRPDIIDCQGLYILPGRGEECTLVNTKIVKRIEMLNRYGKIVMIVLVLAVGLVAVKRLA